MRTNEPEPDIAIVKGKRTDYFEQHPTAGDVAIIIEVADSSLQRDRTLKRGIYAEAAIPVYWIINLVENQIEIYEEPNTKTADYERSLVYNFGQTLPITLNSETIGELNLADEIANG